MPTCSRFVHIIVEITLLSQQAEYFSDAVKKRCVKAMVMKVLDIFSGKETAA